MQISEIDFENCISLNSLQSVGTVTKPEKKETMDWLPVKELGAGSWREKEASSAIEHC